MSPFHQIATAGFIATAISYGPARIGFGLFVPEFRAAFDLSSAAIGLISSFGFFGFFVSLLIAQILLSQRGPDVPVLAGLVAATVGLTVVAMATNVILLAIGVFLAATSAGFSWTPFNDAVHRKISGAQRPKALSEISTGTSIGIIAAGVAALATVFADLSWRICWFFFAAASGVACIIARAAMPKLDRNSYERLSNAAQYFWHGAVAPLVVVGFVFGATSSIYISFAADHMKSSGGLPGLPAAATPALVFMLLGLFGLLGLVTGHVRSAIGLPRLLRLLMLAGAVSTILPALCPAKWLGLVPSASLQGIYIMMTSAVLAFWSERLFPSMPALCFAVVLIAMALGSIAGPAISGIISDTYGIRQMFFGTAALPLLVALILRKQHVRESPVHLGRSAPQRSEDIENEDAGTSD